MATPSNQGSGGRNLFSGRYEFGCDLIPPADFTYLMSEKSQSMLVQNSSQSSVAPDAFGATDRAGGFIATIRCGVDLGGAGLAAMLRLAL